MPKRILIAPLDWGLGHATRCIPIIKSLLEKNTVAIASDGEALELLRKEFPNLEITQHLVLTTNEYCSRQAVIYLGV